MPASNHDNDPSWVGFLKATIAGGLLFLLPLILVVLLFSHAMRIAGKVAHPISEFLTLDKVAGPAGEEGLAVLTLILISVAADFSRAPPGGAISCAGPRIHFSAVYRNTDWSRAWQRGLPRSRTPRISNRPSSISRTHGRLDYLLETLQKGWVAVFFRRPRHQFRAM